MTKLKIDKMHVSRTALGIATEPKKGVGFMIQNQDQLIDFFVSHGSGMKKLVTKLTGEECDYEREVLIRGQRRGEIDIVATTRSGQRVCFEVYYALPSVSNVLQKIKHRMRRMGPRCIWVALIPQDMLHEYGPHLAYEGIHVAAWSASDNGVTFYVAGAYQIRK